VSDLIGTTTTTEPAELRLYHRNPRRGDVQAIANSLRSNSQYRPLTANIGTLTGRPNEILAGNHTAMALWALAEEDPADPRWKSVQVHWVDVDDEGCRRIVLADNRTAELGGFDTAELVALLDGMSGVELADVGYSLADYADLQAALEEQDTDLTAILDRPPPRRATRPHPGDRHRRPRGCPSASPTAVSSRCRPARHPGRRRPSRRCRTGPGTRR